MQKLRASICRVVAMFAVTVASVGCTDSGTSAHKHSAGSAAVASQKREVSRRLFENSVDLLNRLDDYDQLRVDSAVEQVVRRLNESLEAGVLDRETSEPFTVEDGKTLRELVWLRETGRFAVGDATDPLERARKLFDWTVRNVQRISDAAPASAGVVDERLPYLPWHILVLGRGTALDRSWLFAMLARQQGMDVVLLGPDAANPGDAAMTSPSSFRPALMHEGKLYLFDMTWDVPIPDKAGDAVATLDQVQQDDALLRALDLNDADLGDGAAKFPLTSAEAAKLTAYVDTSSLFLAPRFRRLESLLTGDSKLVLSIEQDKLPADVQACAGVNSVKPWPLRDERFDAARATAEDSPAVTARKQAAYAGLVTMLSPFRAPPLQENTRVGRSPIWEARIQHVAGRYHDPLTGKTSITRRYQDARPSEAELKPLGVDRDIWAYAHRIKSNATYWLGLVSFDLGNYDTAAQYFDLVLADEVNGGWTAGARYNLGRTYEALGDKAKALETYRATKLGVKPDPACLYRAKRLQSETSPKGEPKA